MDANQFCQNSDITDNVNLLLNVKNPFGYIPCGLQILLVNDRRLRTLTTRNLCNVLLKIDLL